MLTPGMTVEGLLTNESFINYCKGSEEETIYWDRLLLENPQHTEIIEAAKKTFIGIFCTLALEDRETELEKLSRKMETHMETPVIPLPSLIKKRTKYPGFLKVAVVIAFVLLTWFVRHEISSTRTPVLYSYYTKTGEKKTVQLPDGSIVMLNGGSKIEISASFGLSERNISLAGEAFFDVKKNQKIPFIVHTSTIDVRALGTAFNVKAYPGEKKSETTLIRGLIEVKVKNQPGPGILLHPHQKLQWDNRGITAAAAPGPASHPTKENVSNTITRVSETEDGDINEVAWIENKLVFSDQSLEEIAPMLERWYGVKIEFHDNAVRSYTFTATFQKENLETVLMVLKESRDFQYRMVPGDTTTVIITK